jgi:glycosyltransferase involved in cell wall biosynthesis
VSARPRILYVHHGGALGGAPLSLLTLLEQLDPSRYERIVLAFRPGPAVDQFRAAGIETHVAQGIVDFSHTALEWYGGADLWRLPARLVRFGPSVAASARYLRRLRPDLVHLNSSTLAAPARAARRAGIPVVWHIREPLADGYVGLRAAWLRRRIDRDATRVIAISQHDAARLRPSPRIHVIPNAVDFTVFDRGLSGADARRMLTLPPTVPIVTMLGGVARPKGTLTFVRALPLVRAAVPGIRFLVVGPPPAVGSSSWGRALARRVLRVDAYTHQVLAACHSSGDGTLTFLGVRIDIPRVLAATDLLAFPSVVPHSARPIIEAGAMARPVVASRLGGALELVEDGVTGRLVTPADPEALAEAVVAILRDRSAARAMGEAGYARARAHHDAATNARRIRDVYTEILA